MTQTPTDALRLVPVEPTSIMTQEGLAILHTDGGDDMEAIRLIYRAMLEVAPRREFQDCGCGLGDKCPDPPAAPASPLPGGGWQDISTAPRDGTHVLLSEGHNVWEGRAVESYGRWGWWERNAHPTDYCGSEDYPTHWMPLPAAPTGDA